ncbi:MAG: hypothetical protein NTV34_03785 [Proteobacteria bacterium]|nr:hypothetical protein [Pseudomonadota bacterium]
MTQYFAARAARFTLSMLLVAGITSTSFGQGVKDQPTTAQRQALTERHKKMADMHTKMAACLESEKAPAVCRQEMIDTCSSDFGGSFPMMGKGMGKRGGRGKGMMNGSCMDWMMSPESNTTTAPVKPQPTK